MIYQWVPCRDTLQVSPLQGPLPLIIIIPFVANCALGFCTESSPISPHLYGARPATAPYSNCFLSPHGTIRKEILLLCMVLLPLLILWCFPVKCFSSPRAGWSSRNKEMAQRTFCSWALISIVLFLCHFFFNILILQSWLHVVAALSHANYDVLAGGLLAVLTTMLWVCVLVAHHTLWTRFEGMAAAFSFSLPPVAERTLVHTFHYIHSSDSEQDGWICWWCCSSRVCVLQSY